MVGLNTSDCLNTFIRDRVNEVFQRGYKYLQTAASSQAYMLIAEFYEGNMYSFEKTKEN